MSEYALNCYEKSVFLHLQGNCFNFAVAYCMPRLHNAYVQMHK